jgi:hypothetical protein
MIASFLSHHFIPNSGLAYPNQKHIRNQTADSAADCCHHRQKSQHRQWQKQNQAADQNGADRVCDG